MESLTIIGAGGIGCAVGYALRAVGLAVTLVDANADKVQWGREYGVAVDRLAPLRVNFEHFTDCLPTPDAVVLLCTKCYNNAEVLACLPASVVLLPIQNGFDSALEDQFTGPEGIASFVSECHPERTHTRITRAGRLHLGFRGLTPEGERERKALDRLIDLFKKTKLFKLTAVPDILPYKYTKLMYNAAISPLAAAAGLDNGQLLSVPLARRLFFALLRENYHILRDAGVALGKIGPFHPDTVVRILRRPFVANSLAWAFYPTLRKTYCSMSGDLPRGCTEIDYYNGHLIHLARDRPCPLNRRVYALVKRMERERIPPRVEMLNELAIE